MEKLMEMLKVGGVGALKVAGYILVSFALQEGTMAVFGDFLSQYISDVALLGLINTLLAGFLRSVKSQLADDNVVKKFL
jgi:hypothetical protein